MLRLSVEEQFDYVLDLVGEHWYHTCLPADRVGIASGMAPRVVVKFLLSALVSATLLDRRATWLATRSCIVGLYARLYDKVLDWAPRQWPTMSLAEHVAWCSTAEGFQLLHDDHRARLSILPQDVASMRQAMSHQYPWIWHRLTASQREMLCRVANEYCAYGCLHIALPPMRVIEPGRAKELADLADTHESDDDAW